MIQLLQIENQQYTKIIQTEVLLEEKRPQAQAHSITDYAMTSNVKDMRSLQVERFCDSCE